MVKVQPLLKKKKMPLKKKKNHVHKPVSMDSSLISDPREPKWVAEISQLLDHQLEIEVQIPPVSIFQIPETITTKKPEAYKPQQLGFGPYHHFQPGPYSKMEQKKLVSLQRFLKDHKIMDFRRAVVVKVEKIVPVMRACYETFIQNDDVSMAWVFAIDGLFLLNLLKTYDGEHPKLDPTKRLLAQDIMMVENQIPFMVLKEINQALHSSSGSERTSFDLENARPSFSSLFGLDMNFPSASIFRSFSEIHSPLELCSRLQAPIFVEHLLDYMYRSITYNQPTPEASFQGAYSYSGFNYFSAAANVSNFFKKVPQKEIGQLYEQTITTLQKFSKSSKITIPSASKLQGFGFRFHDLPQHEGMQNINIDGNNFYLSHVTLNNESEVILRNLIAYEMLLPDSNDYHPLTEYMGLMCGLIVDVDDVKILKKENIIKGKLGDGEVVKIFVEISGSITSFLKKKQKSELQELIDKVNKDYESRLKVRACSLMKKLASWVLVGLTHIGSFVGATWKIVAFVISIVTVFMLTYQAYCDVYGCDKNNVTLLPYASS